MEIPNKIKIGDKEFEIRKKRIIDWTNKGVSGQIDFNNNIIKIRKRLDIKDEESTFFHELAHGILRELEFNYPKMVKFRNDESFVEELGLLLRKTFLNLKSSVKSEKEK